VLAKKSRRPPAMEGGREGGREGGGGGTPVFLGKTRKNTNGEAAEGGICCVVSWSPMDVHIYVRTCEN
jgi:hypothetical protein